MRKYLKPAMEMEAFEVEDVITVSTPIIQDVIEGGSATPDFDFEMDFN